MKSEDFIDGLLDFVQHSPTPFHAVQNMQGMLEDAGFQRLMETDAWDTKGRPLDGRYYVIRNDSAVVAFVLNRSLPECGIQMVGAHTDSPCLKVKPNPEITQHGYLQLGVEVYGGALLNPWFDRDLSLAGRISFINAEQQMEHRLVDWKKAMAVIPSLAIHLDREANEKRTINKQKHLPPVLMKMPDSSGNTAPFETLLLDLLNSANDSVVKAVKVLAHELSFYDVQPPAIIGMENEFISSARLDNLLSCYVGLMALIHGGKEQNNLLICNDHEEVGSVSAAGAQGTLLKSVLSRFCDDDAQFSRMIASSLMVSVDNAHAVHPNYADKHDSKHGPIINGGPVIKVNANQRYASNSESMAEFRHLCERLDVPVQNFAMRSDMGCGSTIGPITASQLGVKTVDVGVPTLAMHSIRELAGVSDVYDLFRVLRQIFH